jgi:23S rRNA (adenine2503-C2)-methyltransferase
MEPVARVHYPWEGTEDGVVRKTILDYDYDELRDLLASWQMNLSNAERLFVGLHRRHYANLDDFSEMQLRQSLLRKLKSSKAPPLHPFRQVDAHPSEDGSVKYVFHLRDGLQVEAVYMPFASRTTLCLSSQVGCALGCTFCATGAMGFKRHLTPGEIVGQVYHMRRQHFDVKQENPRYNVVFMGMGEPLHNLKNLMKAFELLTHRFGLVMSEKDIGVSTSGLVPRIRELAQFEKRPRLMISIASTTNEARSAIMPVNRAYPLEKLMETLEAFPLKKGEKLMLSYVVIAGVNDTEADAERLSQMASRLTCLVNLIPMNEHNQSPGMREPHEEALQRFYQQLLDRDVFATIRRSRGRDVGAACGQLIAQVEDV